MSTLNGHVEDYLGLRRALGYKLERHGVLLPKLVAYLEAAGATTPHQRAGDRLGHGCRTARPNHWAARLTVARGSPVTCRPSSRPPRCHRRACSPPAGTARPPTCGRRKTYVASSKAPGGCRSPLRAATHEALFGLLAAYWHAHRRSRRPRTRRRRAGRRGHHHPSQRSSTAPAWCRCTRRTTTALSRYSTDRDRSAPPRSTAFFLPAPAPGSTEATSTRRSARSPPPWASAPHGPPAGASPQAQPRCGNPDRLAPLRRQRRRAHRSLSTYLGHVSPADTYWYLSASPELHGPRRRTARRPLRRPPMTALAPALQAFFTDRLIGQRAASPNTIAAYKTSSPTAARLRRRTQPPKRPPPWTSPISTRR